MQLCAQCFLLGHCRELRSRLVTDEELANTAFVRDLRAHAYGLGLTCDTWREFITDAYRDYAGRIVDARGIEVTLNLEAFEIPSARYWFRDFCCAPCPADVEPRVRREARERVRVLATILRAIDPVRAAFWGVRVANEDAAEAPVLPTGKSTSLPVGKNVPLCGRHTRIGFGVEATCPRFRQCS